MNHELELVYDLSNGVISNDLECPLTADFKGMQLF